MTIAAHDSSHARRRCRDRRCEHAAGLMRRMSYFSGLAHSVSSVIPTPAALFRRTFVGIRQRARGENVRDGARWLLMSSVAMLSFANERRSFISEITPISSSAASWRPWVCFPPPLTHRRTPDRFNECERIEPTRLPSGARAEQNHAAHADARRFAGMTNADDVGAHRPAIALTAATTFPAT